MRLCQHRTLLVDRTDSAATDTDNDFSPVIADTGIGTFLTIRDSLDSLGGTVATDDDIFTAKGSVLGSGNSSGGGCFIAADLPPRTLPMFKLEPGLQLVLTISSSINHERQIEYLLAELHSEISSARPSVTRSPRLVAPRYHSRRAIAQPHVRPYPGWLLVVSLDAASVLALPLLLMFLRVGWDIRKFDSVPF